MKIIHLPTTVGGNPQCLSRYLNESGLESETLTLHQNYFNYQADRVICAEGDNLFIQELKKLWALRYVLSYDIAFFNFGSTLFMPFSISINANHSLLSRLLRHSYSLYLIYMQWIELTLLKLLKKPMFIQYQGDDARQGDYCLKNFAINVVTRVEPTYYTADSDALKRQQIELLSRHCVKSYALNPDLLHVLPARSEFLPYSHISLVDWLPLYTQFEKRPLRIGHAPSHRGVKGTDLIIAAVEKLRDAGYKFEFILVEGLSNQEAKKCYQTIDVLVDQLFAGWYGGLAVEAMALGKPVLVYIRDEDMHFIPEQMRQELPFIQVTPDTIEHGLMHVLDMPRSELVELAKRSRNYVERWHDPVQIAQRIKADIEEAMMAVRK